MQELQKLQHCCIFCIVAAKNLHEGLQRYSSAILQLVRCNFQVRAYFRQTYDPLKPLPRPHL
jgi:hypothetical protein